ncbi:hypothetical protein B1C78_10650 [Thioalkalivibrio denitrificans]|uniref:Uncharacterized protein n=1 Tax=Thioalkalivibrio denitrificans TaxID=108003 RepID=A0A1V3NFF2_9GAMM|nr:hypothetical protein [Thioalkalivibrio denitrificans]OOG23582.1 hypothetical protein B1C78_10650 [Thioalkalivibrio denitrificans]
MSDALQLSGELVQQLQQALAENDPRCRDPLVATQYLAAVMGYMLASQPIEEGQKREYLEQLNGFVQHVFNDVVAQQQRPAAPPQEASGVWKPGDA